MKTFHQHDSPMVLATMTFSRPLLTCGVFLLAIVPFKRCWAESSIVVTLDPKDIRTVEWLKQNHLCDYIDLEPTASESEIASLKEAGWKVLLHMMGHPESFERQYHLRKKLDITLNDVVQRHLRASKGNAGDVVWQILMEEDSAGVAFSQQLLREKPRTHAAAYDLFVKRLREAVAVAQPYPGIRLWGRAGFASSMHPYASLGLEAIILERTNDDIDDLSTGLAFARGAAHQYGCKWGIDFSQWWTAVDGCDLMNSASHFRRYFYLTYFAGANSIGIESLGPLPDDAKQPGTTLADSLLEFGRFRNAHPQGTPLVPVAVVLPRDNGWITPAYWHSAFLAWNYARIPYRPGDRGIDGIFACAFPGSTYVRQPLPFGAYSDGNVDVTHSLASVTSQYAPNPEDVRLAPPPIPFGEFRTPHEAGDTLLKERRESADYRPMADSRWGDILDVITEDASIKALAKYKLLILAGNLTVNDALLSRLKQYVDSGGVLFWSAGAARPQHVDFTQCRMTPRLKQGRAWRWENEPTQTEAFLYVPTTLNSSSNVSTIACSSSDDPLVVKARYGQGYVVTCLLPWLESEHRPLSGVALRSLDELIHPIQPVVVEGLPVQFVCTQDAGGITVCIANHADVSWSGKVRVRCGHDLDRCVELRSGRDLAIVHNGGLPEVHVTINRYDVAVLRWSSRPTAGL